MSVFADSSALVKLYADEPGYREIRRLPGMLVSVLARVEVPAAMWRKSRTGELDSDAASVLVAEFEADYFGTHTTAPRFVAVTTAPAVLDTAARLSAVHGLRAYGAVQLASAVAARDADPGCDELAVFDAQLRTAAAIERFRLLPAEIS
ncbi:MAG: VapC toxin family PIN domain ribonuclease [Actinobacteria bacterium 69-20]|nr:type II toxin-antitoxin system VapC family toxin [Actinomycetota bacterium]OJV26012.1 MAG: VapC toxin family PIN domain ribonuclease [Actinobacteria bacterium 69-20]